MKRTEEKATIVITKVFYDEEPSHWECDVYNSNGANMGGATAPTFAGAYDSAYEIIVGGYDYDVPHNDWTEFDANKQ